MFDIRGTWPSRVDTPYVVRAVCLDLCVCEVGDDRVPCEKGHQAQNKHDEAPDVNEATWCKYRSSIILKLSAKGQ